MHLNPLRRIGLVSALILSLVCLSKASAAVSASFQCSGVFATPVSKENKKAVQRSIQELAELRIRLDVALAQGQESIGFSVLSRDYQSKEIELLEYLEKYNLMTAEEFSENLKSEITDLQKKKSKSKAKTEAKSPRRVLEDMYMGVFHRVEPGSFKMGEKNNQVDVTITRPFEMMETPTTAHLWSKVIFLIHKKLPGKYDDKFDLVEGPESQFDERPVATVNYNQIQLWLSGLNELSKNDEPGLKYLISGHKKGAVYRLPTDAEWEFVVRGRGEYNETYPFGKSKAQLSKFAWYGENSDYQTHPVRQKRPIIVDGKSFYDMLGNVAEWVSGGHKKELEGGIDPQPHEINNHGILRGGSFYDPAHYTTSARREKGDQSYGYNHWGFRMLREVK